MGIDPDTAVYDKANRPVAINQGVTGDPRDFLRDAPLAA